MGISIKSKGDFKNLEKLLKKSIGKNYRSILEKYGQEGVRALASATPIDTGETAGSWYYEITQTDNSLSVTWKNSHVERGCNIAILLQYGHATGTGGYVQGRDYINPALQPIFDKLANDAWKEVTSI
jgi:hypothetical protein